MKFGLPWEPSGDLSGNLKVFEKAFLFSCTTQISKLNGKIDFGIYNCFNCFMVFVNRDWMIQNINVIF